MRRFIRSTAALVIGVLIAAALFGACTALDAVL